MAESLPFVREHTDLSTDRGFQFEFHCDRCAGGARSRLRAWSAGSAGGLLDAAGGLLGGVFSGAADVSGRVRSSGWQHAHDQTYDEAVAEIRGTFAQCPRCSQWVCRKACWSVRRGVCKDCAPDPDGAPAAAPAEQRAGPGICTRCGQALPERARFCASCGESVG